MKKEELLAKELNGKQIKYRDGEDVYDAFVLCDVNIGITVKPFDPETVTDDGRWSGEGPTDPGFYFYCYVESRDYAPADFDFRVANLLRVQESYSFGDITGRSHGNGMNSPCPFSVGK